MEANDGLTEEAKEWIKIFSRWPNGEKEAHKRCLTRRGIPDIVIPVGHSGKKDKEVPLRTVLWKYLLLHPASAFANFFPGSVTSEKSRLKYYQNLLRKTPAVDHKEAIEKDLKRSSPPGYEGLLTEGKIDELRRILVAYSIYDPELGYCQGLNFIAFMLLIHLEESDAFWGLLLLLNGFNIRKLFMKNSDMLQQFLKMLENELQIRFPQLYKHMDMEGITVTMYAMEWLTTFFVYNFPLEATRRIWDIMLIRGFEGGCGSLAWIYQISMAIFEITHKQILEWDIDEIMTSLRTITTEIHPSVLLQKAIDFYPTDALQKKLQLLASQNMPYQQCVIS